MPSFVGLNVRIKDWVGNWGTKLTETEPDDSWGLILADRNSDQFLFFKT
jgi:hypothetical protein